MREFMHHYGEITVALFLLYFTHSMLLGGGTAANGYVDELGYYVNNHGNYAPVSAVNYYLNLVLHYLGFWGTFAIVPMVLAHKVYRRLLENRDEEQSKTSALRARNGLLMAARFPAYTKVLLNGEGTFHERYQQLLAEKEITSYELIDSGLAFYFVCYGW